jgi:tagatose-1,6-bisphosphate aldolase
LRAQRDDHGHRLRQRGGIRKLLAEDKTEQAKISDGMRGDVKIDVVRDLAAHAPSAPLDAVCAAPRVSATTLIRAGLRPSDVAPARFDHAVSRP